MHPTVDASRVIFESASRLYLAGERQRAYEILRCDPSNNLRTQADFERQFARRIVLDDAQRFAESVMQRAYDDKSTNLDTRRQCRDAMSWLEFMDGNEVVQLTNKLLNAGPHDVSPGQVAALVLSIVGRWR